MEGQLSDFIKKDLDLCFKDEQMSYRFGRHEGEYLMTSFLGELL